MFIQQIFEAAARRVIVTYPGRFQPFHKGHAEVFANLQRKYGGDNVFIVTSNKTDAAKSPFSFSDKVQFMHAMGVPNHNIVQADQVYDLPAAFDNIKDQVIFITVIGAPDEKRLQPGRIKKDGTPGYFQPLPSSAAEFQTADKHGYVIIEPEHPKSITVGGKTYDVSHGTPTRDLWNQVRNNPKQRQEFIQGLYGVNDPELGKILDKIPTGAAPAPEPAKKMKNVKKDLAKVQHNPNAVAESNGYEHGFADPNAPQLGAQAKASFKRQELQHELGHERNNLAIAINGKTWKVIPGKGYADSFEERQYLKGMQSWAAKKSASSGKKWTVHLTGAPVTVDESFFGGAKSASKWFLKKDGDVLRTVNGEPFTFKSKEDAVKWAMKTYKVSYNQQRIIPTTNPDKNLMTPTGAVVAEGKLNEFAPDEGGGSRKFIPWPEFIEQLKQIVGKDFDCVENVVKTTIKARFVPHDPMEYGPTMLYSYYETRAGGRNKGAISTRGSIQVGKYFTGGLFGQEEKRLLTSFNLLKGHPFERHFDLTFDNIYKIANIIKGNTQGALEFQPQQQGVAEGEKSPMFKDAQRTDRVRSLKNLIAIAREQGRQLRVQELELELKKLQGVAEGLNEFAIDKNNDGDGRSKLIGSIMQLLKAGKKVDFFVPGIRGHVVGSGGNGDWLTLKRWNKPYSKINYSLSLDSGDDSRFALKMVKPDYYQVVEKEDLNQGVAEGAGNIGSAIKSLYQKIYNAGDDEIDYFYHDSPIFAHYWDEYEGDLDSIIAEVDPEELQVILDELESYIQQANLAEGGIATVGWPDEGNHTGNNPPVSIGGTFPARPVVKKGSLVKVIGISGVHRVMDIRGDQAYIVQEIPNSGGSNYVPMSDLRVWTNKPIAEFAPPGGGGDDGFSDETLKRMAAQWWKNDEDPRIEQTLAAAGWEIGQDEGYDNGGVFVVQSGDEHGKSYMSWPAEELEGQLDEKSVSKAQFRTMAAAAHNPEFAKKVGIEQGVAREFHSADKKQNYKKLPSRVKENAEQLHIGDPVIITGDVQFRGKTGDIDSFGANNRFVIVNLYNHGKHSFHSSDVSYNDYADQDDDLDEDMYQYDAQDPYNSEFAPRAGMGRMTLRGWKQQMIKRTAELAQQMAAAGQDIDKAALWDNVYQKLKGMNMDPIAQEIELAHKELENIRRRGGIRSRAFKQ